MADVSKSYGVGDTVWARYPFPHPEYWYPKQRVVKSVEILNGSNDAKVTFEGGDSVEDKASFQAIFDTEALAATAIVNDVISKSAAAVVTDATTSSASTAGQASNTLGRIS